MDELLIISPLFPPMEGGLPDHTDRLAHALLPLRPVRVLTSTGADSARPFPVEASITRWQARPQVEQAVARTGTGPVLWQYVPHMYGRGGVNLTLPGILAGLRRSGRHQLLLAHEIRAPLSLWPQRLAYALAHRWMWRGIRPCADAIGISTAGWLESCRAEDPRADAYFLAPSPSNLPVAETSPSHAADWRAARQLDSARLVLGFFGSTGGGKQFDWVLEAWRRVSAWEPGCALVVIGGGRGIRLPAREASRFRALGYLPAPEASRALQAVDLLLLPFLDGVSERRSSFMAALAHGTPLVTRLGPATGEELRASAGIHFRATNDTGGRAEFAEVALQAAQDLETSRIMARRGRRQYREHYDWPQLAARIHQRLSRLESPRP